VEGAPELLSAAFVIADPATGEVMAAKNPDAPVAIASITKLMTAMVVLDAQSPLTEPLTIAEEDRDLLKGSSSRLAMGTTLSRGDLLRLALMSSENRAASALGRHYPGGRPAFVAAMNAKAQSLGLAGTRFADPTGLSPENVSTPLDLVTMVRAASDYALIRELSTTHGYALDLGDRVRQFRNTNALVGNPEWQIDLQKTGFIQEAGRCLVMQARVLDRPVVMVLMDANGRRARIEDAARVKRWLEGVDRTKIATGPRSVAG
jgi:D-alanyl-D-alanine endopeptidase (penicillin-binding protein 7)